MRCQSYFDTFDHHAICIYNALQICRDIWQSFRMNVKSDMWMHHTQQFPVLVDFMGDTPHLGA
jgi:hypothetical protein